MTPKALSREIKWAYQRVVRGYDDRVYWGFDCYFLRVMPALKSFCEDYLKLENGERAKLNPERANIFRKTITLIDEWERATYEEVWDCKKQNSLLAYVGKNSGYYWD